jgi:hypothetical protein
VVVGRTLKVGTHFQITILPNLAMVFSFLSDIEKAHKMKECPIFEFSALEIMQRITPIIFEQSFSMHMHQQW